MIASTVVLLGEGIDLLPEFIWQLVVFQQDAVLGRLIPALDLALGLRVKRGTADVIHLLVFEPISQFARDIAQAIVAEQARLVQDRCLITPRCLQRQVQRVGHVVRLHRRAGLPGDDVPVVVVEDRAETEPASADHFQIGEVGLPYARQGIVQQCPRGGARWVALSCL